jgi:hypothetical protein
LLSPSVVIDDRPIVNGIFVRLITNRIPMEMSNGKDQRRGLDYG